MGALNRGADIVITGRTTDAAIVAGPAAWHHGWARDDWDAMAGAVAAGHVIECGTQATGGNYSFFAEIPGLERAGFPIAEVEADGSAVITKHPGTGGAVTVGTVTTTPVRDRSSRLSRADVTARFDTMRLAQEGLIGSASPAQGERPPATLKVSTNAWGGYRVTSRSPSPASRSRPRPTALRSGLPPVAPRRSRVSRQRSSAPTTTIPPRTRQRPPNGG